MFWIRDGRINTDFGSLPMPDKYMTRKEIAAHVEAERTRLMAEWVQGR